MAGKNIGEEIGRYFLPGSREYETVVSEWEGWLKWKPAKRKTKHSGEEQPEYRDCFAVKTDGEDAEVIFKKRAVFGGKIKKEWSRRVHGIIKNTSGYQLTV